jgi:hypothetical protein
MSVLDKGVVKRENLATMVDAYHTACNEIDKAFELLNSAKVRMESAYGAGGATSFDCIYLIRYHNTAKEVKGQIKKGAWQALLNRLEIKKVMSIKDMEKMYKSFEDVNSIPEIDLTTLTEITISLLENAPEYAKKLVKEAYDFLMQGNGMFNHYKTNEKNARRSLGKKVILTWIVEPSYGEQYQVKYGRPEDQLIAVDKVFFTLDGKGIPPGYRSPLVDTINTTSIKNGFGETEYFKFWCYRNNNLHLEFKRPDLVKKLNKIAGDGTTLSD